MKAKKSNTETRRHRVLFYVTLYEGLRFLAARCRKLSQACNFPLHAAGSFRRLAISRCTLQEAFVGLQFLAARCRKLSQGCNSLLHAAGGFRRPPIPCCTLQEAFVGLQFLAARCRKLSQAFVTDFSPIWADRSCRVHIASLCRTEPCSWHSSLPSSCRPSPSWFRWYSRDQRPSYSHRSSSRR